MNNSYDYNPNENEIPEHIRNIGESIEVHGQPIKTEKDKSREIPEHIRNIGESIEVHGQPIETEDYEYIEQKNNTPKKL